MTAMNKVNKWTVHNNYIKRYQNGYPLITKDAIVSGVETAHEGDVVHLVDEDDYFIAKAYYGEQNKGIGWVLTNHMQTRVDDAFFQRLIGKAINTRSAFYKSDDTNAFRVFNG